MTPQRATPEGVLTIVTLLKREKARAMIRAAFPRRRAQLVAIKGAVELDAQLTAQLVDAVIIDTGVGEEAGFAIARAEDFQSIPFVLMTSMLPAEAPLLARAAVAGITELLVDGVDDGVARELVQRRAFSTRFERAMAVAPRELGLETPLQLAVWRSVVRRAGRPVRTDQLAQELDVSREHLSRSFAQGAAPTLKRVIDLVRVLAAAELAKNTGFDVRDVAQILGFASSSHLSSTTQRLVGARASSLTRLRAIDLLARFQQQRPESDETD